MTTQSVLAICDDREKARKAIAALLKAGVTKQCISVISREDQLTTESNAGSTSA